MEQNNNIVLLESHLSRETYPFSPTINAEFLAFKFLAIAYQFSPGD